MFLKYIRILQFKNYPRADLEFSSEINCLLGKNGSGKTNILDAVHFLCLTKSGFFASDTLHIMHENDFFTLEGEFVSEQKSIDVRCVVEMGKKKQMLHKGSPIEKMSDHIGLFPVVMIAPDDSMLIKDGSEERRKFFDNILCQMSKAYLEQLMRYNAFLKQRNSLLKQWAEKGIWNKDLIDAYDQELIPLSIKIAKQRATFLEDFEPTLKGLYEDLSEGKEEVSLTYQSDSLNDNFEKEFKTSAKKDLLLKRTNMGIHKDDYIFNIAGFSLKKFGSQGQQKSFVIALKLAQFRQLEKSKGTKPILLLDDIFDKLDDGRIQKLLQLVANHEFGQIFVTDARPERSKALFEKLDAEVRFFQVEGGSLSLLK